MSVSYSTRSHFDNQRLGMKDDMNATLIVRQIKYNETDTLAFFFHHVKPITNNNSIEPIALST